MTKPDHLDLETWQVLSEPPEERIAHIKRDHWIPYGEAAAILRDLGDLVVHPRNLRMPCRALIADSNNGKTWLLHQCVTIHNREGSDKEEPRVAVACFQTPPEPDEGRLYSSILKSLGVEHREDAAPERLLPKVIERCTELEVRLLLADEFHNMLLGPAKDQRQFLGSLKSLINVLGVSFVAAGTDEVRRALAADGQFVQRFQQYGLPLWRRDVSARRLLKSLELRIPLPEASNLDGMELGPKLLPVSPQTIGNLSAVVLEAAIAAISESASKISVAHVDAALKLLAARTLNAA